MLSLAIYVGISCCFSALIIRSMKGSLWLAAVLICLEMLVSSSFQDALAVPHTLEMHKMNEPQKNDTAADFTRPWSSRRGIESIDRNASVVLVKAPLDSLSAVLATTALETRRNILGSEIELSGYFELAYQIVGQAWSIMVPDDRIEPTTAGSVPVPSAAQLSKQIETACHHLGCQ